MVRASAVRKKMHLIDAVPFGRIDQMLRTTDQGRVWGGFAPHLKMGGPGGTPPSSQNRKVF